MTFYLDVNVASKSNKQEKLEKRRKYQEPDSDPNLLVRGADPDPYKKMSWIRNTAFKIPIFTYPNTPNVGSKYPGKKVSECQNCPRQNVLRNVEIWGTLLQNSINVGRRLVST